MSEMSDYLSIRDTAGIQRVAPCGVLLLGDYALCFRCATEGDLSAPLIPPAPVSLCWDPYTDSGVNANGGACLKRRVCMACSDELPLVTEAPR